jgi:hypothetical protein
MSTATKPFFEPGERSMLPQAERDALQTEDPALSREAWDFLEVCAPGRAKRLRRQQAAQFGLGRRIRREPRVRHRGAVTAAGFGRK